MNDILGREVEDGNLVVAKGTGRYNNKTRYKDKLKEQSINETINKIK